MTIFIIIVALFLVLTFLPIVVSLASIKHKKALEIRSDNVKDPRYFAKSFNHLIEKAMKNHDGSDMIRLSRQEAFIRGMGEPFVNQTYNQLLYQEAHDFVAENAVFEKEVWAGRDARLVQNVDVRAIACMHNLTIGDGSIIRRWADGVASCTVGKGCELGISTSSRDKLSVAKDCKFRRLYAPVIRIGEMDNKPMINDFSVKASDDIEHYWDHVDKESVIDTSVVSTGDLTVREGCTIYGSVKSNGDLHICQGAFISGNVFSDGTIVLENDVRVYGHVFSQKDVYIGYDTVIGMDEHIKSVIGRDRVSISERVIIFGYVSTEGEGKTIAADDFENAISNVY